MRDRHVERAMNAGAVVLYGASFLPALGAAPRGAALALATLAAARSERRSVRLAGLAAVVAAIVVEGTVLSGVGALGLAAAAAAGLLAGAALRRVDRFSRAAWRSVDPDLERVLDRLEAAGERDPGDELTCDLPHRLARFEPDAVTIWRPAPGDALRADRPTVRDPDAAVLQARAQGETVLSADGRVIAAPLGAPERPTGWIEARRASPFGGDERAAIAGIARMAGRAEEILRVRRRALVRSQVGELLVRDAPWAESIDEALGVLREELGMRAAGVARYDGGAFLVDSLSSDGWPELEPLVKRSWPIEGGASGAVYESGVARFLDDYAANPLAVASFVDAGVRAAAIRPLPQRPYAKTHLALFHDAPHLWSESDRDLVADVARTLRLSLARDHEARVLQRMLAVEHLLLESAQQDAARELLRELVELVPGAEAGSLLVRRENGFGFDAVVGFDSEALADVTFGEEHLEAWCGGPEAWRAGRVRIASDPAGMERVSIEASEGRMHGQPSLRLITANLSMPVVHRGEVLAVVNLDAFRDPHAFQEEDLTIARAFAPAVAFVLAEARHRRDLHVASTHDALTGLANRRAFDEDLEHELARAERDGTPTSLLIADLTGFKAVNDRFGHAAGDEVLTQVADALRSVARESDRLYRWGGDEFAVILPNTDAPGALSAARRFSRAISCVEMQGLQIGASIGMGVRRSGEGVDPDALMAHADKAMYQAKRDGVSVAEA